MKDKIMGIFDALVPELEREMGGAVHLIRIVGTRWSYTAGRMTEKVAFVAPQRVVLKDQWALIFYAAEGVCVDPEYIRGLFKKQGL